MKHTWLLLALLACIEVVPSAAALAAQSGASSLPAAAPSADVSFERDKLEEAMDLLQENIGLKGWYELVTGRLEEIHKRNPNSAYLYAGLAELQYYSYQSGQATPQEVIALAQRAISLDRNIAQPFMTLAKVYLGERNIGQAKQAADTAIQLAPTKPSALFVQARVAEALGDFKAAEQWYLKAVEASPRAARKSNMYYWLSDMYMKQQPPDFQKALAARTKSVELTPDNPYKLCHFSEFLNKHTDRYDDAIEYAQRSLKIMDVCIARYNLGIALYARWADGLSAPRQAQGNETQAHAAGTHPPRDRYVL